MNGFLIALLGFCAAAVGVVITFGLWTLMPVGAVLFLLGVLVDFDPVKEPHA